MRLMGLLFSKTLFVVGCGRGEDVGFMGVSQSTRHTHQRTEHSTHTPEHRAHTPEHRALGTHTRAQSTRHTHQSTEHSAHTPAHRALGTHTSRSPTPLPLR